MSYSKNYICKFMQANWLHHKLFHFHLSFWIWEAWKRRQKIQKLEYLENEKSFLNEIKNTFHSLWRAIIWWKNKNLLKNSKYKPISVATPLNYIVFRLKKKKYRRKSGDIELLVAHYLKLCKKWTIKLFHTTITLYTIHKHQKTKRLLIFSRGVGRNKRLKMG